MADALSDEQLSWAARFCHLDLGTSSSAGEGPSTPGHPADAQKNGSPSATSGEPGGGSDDAPGGGASGGGVITLPKVGGGDKEELRKNLMVMDTLKPSKDNPELYTGTKDGQEVTLPKDKAEALLAQVSKDLQTQIAGIQAYNHNVQRAYDQMQPEGYMEFVAKRTFSIFGSKDPGEGLDKALMESYAKYSRARADIGKHNFTEAAELMADAEALGLQANHLVEMFASKNESVGSKVITGLQYTKKASFFVAKTIATAEFGKAGAAAIDSIEAGAEALGEAAAGHTIDWSKRVIDLGVNLLTDKFGDQAEGAIKTRLEKFATEKFAKQMAKGKVKALVEKAAGKLASKAVSKGSDYLKRGMNAVVEKVDKTKPMKWEELMQATIKSMSSPGSQELARLEAEMEQELQGTI